MNKFLLLIAVFIWDYAVLFAQKKDYIPSDIAKVHPAPYDYKSNRKYPYGKIKVYTTYITMRDGVRIAADYYLPEDLEAGEKLPTILHQTRYWRAPDLRWPFSMFSNGLIGAPGKIIKEFVAQGYAVVNVDVRGSGASFGTRTHPWSADEVKDGAEIVDWIIRQPWSDGTVGSMGASYSGTTAEFLVTNQHPSVKAVILLYSLFDVYEDIAYPGGIFHRFFVNNWGKFNAKLDRNKLPRGGFLARVLVKGVRRVNTHHKVRTFRAAIRSHEQNRNVDETSRGIEFRGQSPPGISITSDDFSPFKYIDKINASGTVVYSYSGWMDGDYQHACIRRFLNLTNPQNKLTIGPWEHGGRYNCSPANPGEAGFDHIAEFLKFFDYYLKGLPTGIDKEPRVHYFTMVEEAWKTADSWPPAATFMPLYCNENYTLTKEKPSISSGCDAYVMDTTAATGDASRWKSLIGMLKTPYVYPDRKTADEKLLCYTSHPLDKDMEVTGHPLVTLYLTSTEPDGNIHVYLEDVDPQGNVTYVTEGLLRLIHRQAANDFPLYRNVVPQRTYYEKDIAPLTPGEIAEVVIDLIPTSYVFKEGHRIRLAIAGADQSHFKVMHKAIPEICLQRNIATPSGILLPVME